MSEAAAESRSERLLGECRPSSTTEELHACGIWHLNAVKGAEVASSQEQQLQDQLRGNSLPNSLHRPQQAEVGDSVRVAVEEFRTFQELHAPPAAKTTDILLAPSVDVFTDFSRSASDPLRVDDFWRSQTWLNAVKAKNKKDLERDAPTDASNKKDLLKDGQSDELFVSASIGEDCSGAAFRPCSARLACEGIELRPAELAESQVAGSELGSSSTQQKQQWFLPWEAVMDIRSRQPLLDETEGEKPPASHPYVLELSAHFCLGLSSGSSCVLKIAGPHPFDDILGSICKQKWLSEIVHASCRDGSDASPKLETEPIVGRENSRGAAAAFLDCAALSERELSRPSLPSSATVSSHLPYANSESTGSTTAGTAHGENSVSQSRFDGPSTPLHYSIPPDRRQQSAGDPKSAAPSHPGTPAEGRFAQLFHSNTPKSRTIELSEVKQVLSQSLLTAYQADEPKMPMPISIEDCWMHLPPGCPVFHRCSLCVDKLGFSILPLGPKTPVDKPSSKKDLHANGLSFLASESLNFPLTAIIDAEEESTLEHIDKPPDKPVQEAIPQACQPTQQAQQTQPPQQAQAQQQPQLGGEKPGRRTPSLHRRLYTPLARAVFVLGTTMQRHVMGPCQQAAEEDPPARRVPACSADRPPREASHYVSVTIQGSLAGRQPGQERTPPHLRLQADARPPFKITLAFNEKDEVLRLISCLLDFKRYQISVALKSFVQTFAAMAHRERQHAAATREKAAADPGSSLPLSAVRPVGLPPASRLPRIVANEEGEVFWYMPRRQAQCGALSAEQPGASPPLLAAARGCTPRPPPAAPVAASASCQHPAQATEAASRLEADECLCQVAVEAPPYISPVPSPGRPDPAAASVGTESHRLFTVSV